MTNFENYLEQLIEIKGIDCWQDCTSEEQKNLIQDLLHDNILDLAEICLEQLDIPSLIKLNLNSILKNDSSSLLFTSEIADRLEEICGDYVDLEIKSYNQERLDVNEYDNVIGL